MLISKAQAITMAKAAIHVSVYTTLGPNLTAWLHVEKADMLETLEALDDDRQIEVRDQSTVQFLYFG